MAAPVKKTILKQSAGEEKKSKPMVVVEESFTVDKEARYTGTVSDYSKWRGFGHIDMDEKGVVPSDNLFVYWKNIQTDDRFPRLQEGLKVEFGLMITYEWKAWMKVKTVKAKTVTLPGGGMINLQDAMDAETKQFVGAQNFRYTGTLKFYDQWRAFGWVIMDDGFAMDEAVPKEIKVEKQELNCCGKPPNGRLEKLAVEFGIVKSKKGDQYMVYNMTLPGGIPITQDNIEHRQEVGSEKYQGTISWWHRSQAWGHISPDPAAMLPAAVVSKLEESAAAAQAKEKTPGKEADKLLYFRKQDCDWNVRPEIGKKVTFSVYVDDKGAGACKVGAVESS